jgi:hypothetical protein
VIYYQGWKIHVHREGAYVHWWVRHWTGRTARGRQFTHNGAVKAAKYAIGDMRQGLEEM